MSAGSLTLVNGALTPVEQEVLLFARRYGLDVEGRTTQAGIETGRMLCPWGQFHPVADANQAVSDNVASADLVVILSDSMVETALEALAIAAAAINGKPIVDIRPGWDWQDPLKAALRDPDLRRLYLFGGTPEIDADELIMATRQLLPAIFNFLDPRDPAVSLITVERAAERIAALRQRYPYQFPESLPPSMLTPEPGWLDLLEKLCADIDNRLPAGARAQFQWKQIKEKFGGLRAYWSLGPLFCDMQHPDGTVTTMRFTTRETEDGLWDQVDALVEAAMEQSRGTCGDCGAPGRLRRREWLRTLCELHTKPGWEQT